MNTEPEKDGLNQNENDYIELEYFEEYDDELEEELTEYELKYEKRMNFYSSLVIVFCSFLIVFSLYHVAYNYFTNDIYFSDSGKNFLTSIDIGNYDGMLSNDCNAVSFYLKAVDEEIDKLPEGIITSFYENGGEIHIVDDIEDLFEIPKNLLPFGILSGCYLPDKNDIYLRYVYSSKSDVIHELGHYVENTNNLVDNNFEKIFEEEKNIYKDKFDTTDYPLTSSKEYFAACFKSYFISNDKLKDSCPKTYDFISNALETYY